MTENYEAHIWTAKLLADIEALVSEALKDRPSEMLESISYVIDGTIPVELFLSFGSPKKASFEVVDNQDGTLTLK